MCQRACLGVTDSYEHLAGLVLPRRRPWGLPRVPSCVRPAAVCLFWVRAQYPQPPTPAPYPSPLSLFASAQSVVLVLDKWRRIAYNRLRY